ncbi:MAG: glycosyltransferase [Bacilli bacterium]|nr:glycosyltransferase [Bacilli bacterium]
MIKLSIIIPYHKTLELTKELLKVLIPQLTKECELIIVDDDVNTFELDKYASDNVKIIHHKENSGCAGVPRNTGLDNAKGENIVFIDSDDNVPNYYISKILDKTKEEWDYCFMSWQAVGRLKGKYIIRDMPSPQNTSVWNCIYKRDLIGNTRFSTTKLINEDTEFNLIVRKGIKANILDIMYYYNNGRTESLTMNYLKEKRDEKVEDVKTQVVIYRSYLSKLGGIETAIYNLCNALKDIYDVVYVYDTADIHQLRRLKQLVKCVQYSGQKIICDKVIYYGFNPATIEGNIIAKEYIQQICCDVKEVNFHYTKQAKTNVFMADSKASAKQFTDWYPEYKCGVLHNLFDIKKPKRCLSLMTASRLSWEKGYDRMKALAKRMNERGIPFTWEVFTNDLPNEEIDGFIFRKPRLNVIDYMSNKDYGIQLSNTESWGCTITEFLETGVPVISTDFPSAYEQIEEGKNGFILKRDMSNIDEIIDKMYNNNLKGFKYNKKDSIKEWTDLIGDLGKPKLDYKYDSVFEGYEVEVLKDCDYTIEGVHKVKGDTLTIGTESRLEYLEKLGYVKRIGELI